MASCELSAVVRFSQERSPVGCSKQRRAPSCRSSEATRRDKPPPPHRQRARATRSSLPAPTRSPPSPPISPGARNSNRRARTACRRMQAQEGSPTRARGGKRRRDDYAREARALLEPRWPEQPATSGARWRRASSALHSPVTACCVRLDGWTGKGGELTAGCRRGRGRRVEIGIERLGFREHRRRRDVLGRGCSFAYPSALRSCGAGSSTTAAAVAAAVGEGRRRAGVRARTRCNPGAFCK
jgi:hypothetical protein